MAGDGSQWLSRDVFVLDLGAGSSRSGKLLFGLHDDGALSSYRVDFRKHAAYCAPEVLS